MSKRNLIILIIVILILGLGIFAYFYFYKSKTDTTDTGNNNSYAGFGDSNTQNNNGDGSTPVDVSGYIPGDMNAVDIKLKKISTMPIAGFGVYTRERFKEIPVVNTDTTIDGEPSITDTNTVSPAVIVKTETSKTETEFFTALRYVARATGNIYETFADKIKEQKYSSTIIPKVYDAYFDSKAESVVMRYLKDDGITIETFAGSLPKELLSEEVTGDKELQGSFLSENITDISLSPSMMKIFYLTTIADSVAGITSGVVGDNKNNVFASQFTEWLSQWPNDNMITLTTKPTANLPGYMYAVNPVKKDFVRILGGINGLTTLTSPDGKSVLYSDNTLGLHIYNTVSKNTTDFSIKTMAEKCIWGKINTVIYCAVPKSIDNSYYPDAWYMGAVSFSDQVWKINALDGSAQMIMDPITFPGGEDIDGIKLTFDKDQNYLFFINKKDSFLWEFNLN